MRIENGTNVQWKPHNPMLETVEGELLSLDNKTVVILPYVPNPRPIHRSLSAGNLTAR